MYEVNLCETDLCDCGNETESITHFFTRCPTYNDLRCEITKPIPLECWNTNVIL